MDSFHTLREFENFYDAMLSAQEKSDKAFAWFSGIPHPLFNAVMHLCCTHDVDNLVDSLIQKAPYASPLSFWLHSHNCAKNLKELLKERGFESTIVCPLMSCLTKKEPGSKSSVDIQQAHMGTFYDILATAFHFDPNVRKAFEVFFERIQAENYLIYASGKPVGTGTLFPNGKTGGIFNVSILPSHQRQGLGKAMIQFLKQRAHALLIDKLILLSSPLAENLWLQLGFKRELLTEIFARESKKPCELPEAAKFMSQL